MGFSRLQMVWLITHSLSHVFCVSSEAPSSGSSHHSSDAAQPS